MLVQRNVLIQGNYIHSRKYIYLKEHKFVQVQGHMFIQGNYFLLNIVAFAELVHGPNQNFLLLRGTNGDRCKFEELPKFFNNFDDSSFEWVAFWYIFSFKKP